MTEYVEIESVDLIHCKVVKYLQRITGIFNKVCYFIKMGRVISITTKSKECCFLHIRKAFRPYLRFQHIEYLLDKGEG